MATLQRDITEASSHSAWPCASSRWTSMATRWTIRHGQQFDGVAMAPLAATTGHFLKPSLHRR
jgi:hypothetical protein